MTSLSSNQLAVRRMTPLRGKK